MASITRCKAQGGRLRSLPKNYPYEGRASLSDMREEVSSTIERSVYGYIVILLALVVIERNVREVRYGLGIA